MLPAPILAAFLAFPLLTNALHNVTYANKDPSIIYRPADAWIDWPPGYCPQWQTGGQWTHDQTGTISLKFVGVAVYAYGLWDDENNPIYTITVDDDAPVQLGVDVNPSPQGCEPLYSKTGLSLKNHEITFRFTNLRPNDVKDLSFQGFIVTVPDIGDGFTTETGGGGATTAPGVVSPTSSGGLGGLIPTSVLGGLLPTRTNGAAQRYHSPLNVAGVGTFVATITIMLGLV